MILLDTNVLSELVRPAPDPAVERWLAGQPDASVFISAITEAELRYGAALLPAGRRQTALAAEIRPCRNHRAKSVDLKNIVLSVRCTPGGVTEH